MNADKRQKLTHFGQKGNLKEENNEEHKGFNVTVRIIMMNKCQCVNSPGIRDSGGVKMFIFLVCVRCV